MFRSLALCALFAAPHFLPAQVQIASNVPSTPPEAADLRPAGSTAVLPDAPSAVFSATEGDGGQTTNAPAAGSAKGAIAPRDARIVLPGQTTIPLSARKTVLYGFESVISPLAPIGFTVAAGFSQATDSAPHYGTGAQAFGKREGVAALRYTIQTLGTESLFDPVFHDDPRYYELGPPHKFVPRVLYAASRVFITRSNNGHERVNAPLLLGYGVAAGMNNLYYPRARRKPSRSMPALSRERPSEWKRTSFLMMLCASFTCGRTSLF